MMKPFSTILSKMIVFIQFLLFTIGITTVPYSSAQENNQTDQAYADSQSNQVMLTVIANIETTLDTVAILLNKIVSLRDNNVFPNGMTAADHGLIFGVLGSYYNDIKTHGTSMYLALDDGTSFSNYAKKDEYSGVAYREPGSSGYSILNIQESDPNYKYYIACVNYTDGEQLNCTTEVNSTYVECINDCEPIPCNTSKNDDARSNITYMCRNYQMKVVEENQTLGYIPNTFYCVNQYLQPEQRPGYVQVYDTDGKVSSFGNCLYGDNHTMVNRTLSGDYAACGPNKTCDTTYQGGFYGFDYDLRVDPMYIQTKAAQGPTWTPTEQSRLTALSLTYYLPIYTEGKLNASMTKSLLFEGVISMSFDLDPIADFLRTIRYGNTGHRVFIVEDIEPYYLVGSSIQQFAFNTTTLCDGCENITFDGVTNWVSFYSNTSEVCPYLNGSNPYNYTDLMFNCTTIRASIDKFLDSVSRRAFQKYNETNFVSNERGIYFKEDDAALGTQAYVAYTRLYTKQNLKWHVFVVSQVDRSTTDALLKGNQMFTVICVVATIGFLTCFSLFYSFYQRRTEKAVIHADWRLTCAFIVGCAFINCSSYTLLGENTNQLCMLRMWSFNGLFVCALSPLFVKVWRMAKLLDASTGFHRTTVTNFQAYLYTLPLILLELTFLMIVSIVDPPHATEELGVGDGIGYQVVQCSQNSDTFFYLQTIFHGLLVLVGCFLAYRTRDLDPKYGEARQLAFSMYNIAFTGLITILVISLVQLDQVSKIAIQTVSVLWGSCFCSLAFVLPRLLQVQKDHSLAETGSMSRQKSYTGSRYSAVSVSSSLNIMSNIGLNHKSKVGVGGVDAKMDVSETQVTPEENGGINPESYSKFVGTQMESMIQLNNDKEQLHSTLKTASDINQNEPDGLSDNIEGHKAEVDGAFKIESENL